MHHGAGLFIGKDALERHLVTNVELPELVSRVIGDGGQRVEIGRIGQLIDIHHRKIGLGDEIAAHRRTDEACSAADDDSVHARALRFVSRWPVLYRLED